MYMYCVTVVHEVKVNVNTHTDMCKKPFAAGLTTMRFYIEVENACTHNYNIYGTYNAEVFCQTIPWCQIEWLLKCQDCNIEVSYPTKLLFNLNSK